MQPSRHPGTAVRRVLVWDLPTRLFHGATIVLVAAAYVTWRMNRITWHAWIGEALLALLLFRLLWGFFGSGSARFARFLVMPGLAFHHLLRILRREPDRAAGHNPAGGWMVILLLALLLGQSLTGVYVNNDIASEGPLTEIVPVAVANLISALHTILWDALLAAIALHLVAIAVHRIVKHHRLVAAIVGGYKLLPADVPAPPIAGNGRALALLAAAAFATAVLVRFL
jgi:cytochrome b